MSNMRKQFENMKAEDFAEVWNKYDADGAYLVGGWRVYLGGAISPAPGRFCANRPTKLCAQSGICALQHSKQPARVNV